MVLANSHCMNTQINKQMIKVSKDYANRTFTQRMNDYKSFPMDWSTLQDLLWLLLAPGIDLGG